VSGRTVHVVERTYRASHPTMIFAEKKALENRFRLRLIHIRERELHFYSKNCHMVGHISALLAGCMYSSFVHTQMTWFTGNSGVDARPGDESTLAQVLVITGMTIVMCLSLRNVLGTTMLSMLGPGQALRGPEGSIHSAVDSMLDEFDEILSTLLRTVFSLLCVLIAYSWGAASPSIIFSVLLTVLIVGYASYMRLRLGIVAEAFPLSTMPLISGNFFPKNADGETLQRKVASAMEDAEGVDGAQSQTGPFFDVAAGQWCELRGVVLRGFPVLHPAPCVLLMQLLSSGPKALYASTSARRVETEYRVGVEPGEEDGSERLCSYAYESMSRGDAPVLVCGDVVLTVRDKSRSGQLICRASFNANLAAAAGVLSLPCTALDGIEGGAIRLPAHALIEVLLVPATRVESTKNGHGSKNGNGSRMGSAVTSARLAAAAEVRAEVLSPRALFSSGSVRLSSLGKYLSSAVSMEYSIPALVPELV